MPGDQSCCEARLISQMRARVRSLLDALFRRSSLEDTMDVECRSHIQIYTDDLIQSGVPRPEAERRSRVAFGGIEAVKEQCREARAALA